MSTVIIGFIQPTQPEIIEALAQINQGDADAALASLARAQGTAEIEDTLWKNYVEALILLDLRVVEGKKNSIFRTDFV